MKQVKKGFEKRIYILRKTLLAISIFALGSLTLTAIIAPTWIIPITVLHLITICIHFGWILGLENALMIVTHKEE